MEILHSAVAIVLIIRFKVDPVIFAAARVRVPRPDDRTARSSAQFHSCTDFDHPRTTRSARGEERSGPVRTCLCITLVPEATGDVIDELSPCDAVLAGWVLRLRDAVVADALMLRDGARDGVGLVLRLERDRVVGRVRTCSICRFYRPLDCAGKRFRFF